MLQNAYKLLNALFRDNTCLVGNYVTVADLCTAPNVSQAELILPIDDELYPNIRLWLKRIHATVPKYDELSMKFCREFRLVLIAKMKQNKIAAKISKICPSLMLNKK